MTIFGTVIALHKYGITHKNKIYIYIKEVTMSNLISIFDAMTGFPRFHRTRPWFLQNCCDTEACCDTETCCDTKSSCCLLYTSDAADD